MPILLVLAPYLVPVLLACLTLLVRKGFEVMPSNQRRLVANIVSTAVAAVDQTAPNASGAEKKARAIELVLAQLSHFKINVPIGVLDPMIEEAVLIIHMATDAPSAVIAEKSGK